MAYIRDHVSFPCSAQRSYRLLSEELVEFRKSVRQTWGLDVIVTLRVHCFHPPKDHPLYT
jgi:hypothetical protein